MTSNNIDFEDIWEEVENKPMVIKPSKCFWPRVKKRYIFGGVAGVALVVVVALAFAGVLGGQKETPRSPPDPAEPLPPSASKMHVFRKAAVCADGAPCAEIGKKILEENGTAVDAAIAALFCNGVVTMQSMGLGGGFLLTLYKKDENRSYSLNAREKAPFHASADLYRDDPKKSYNGPLSIAVPGELKGYMALYKRFGTLPWRSLVQPAIDLCENGFKMTKHMHNSFSKTKLHDDPNFKEWFWDKHGKMKVEGDMIHPTKLCKTLKIISQKGGDEFYTGSLAKMFIEDAKEVGALITEEDMEKYEAEWMEPISVTFQNNDVLHSAPPPGSGVLLGFILNILDGYNFDKSSILGVTNTITTYHRIIEAFKYAFARRTELGDTDFVDIADLLKDLTSKEYAEETRLRILDNTTFDDPKHYGAVYYSKEDHGTAHISILDKYGDAVSVTSSVNIYFGAGMTSKQTGIIFNSVMDDFSFPFIDTNYFGLPASPNNEMKPGKRPLSSMCPSIITDENGDVKMVVGASGGTKITTSVAWTIMRALWMGENIKEAVDSPRLHHQLYPMQVEYEYGVLKQVVDGLKDLGHKMKRNSGSVVCAMMKNAQNIIANADFRKGGDVYGIM